VRFLTKKVGAARSPSSNRARPRVEELESRLVPYSLSGSAWPHPEVIRIGVAYDSVNLGGVSSNLFNRFDGLFVHQGVWIPEFLRAAQVWAQHTNLNFVFAIDDGSNLGAGLYQQGDPYKPDIRIGGYDFGSSTLATAYLPPAANNFSIAGDVQFNTAQTWVLGDTGGYNLFTVAMHEIGHALGLGHSSNYYSVMYPYYVGSRAGLGADDINGIRALYSGGADRSPDSYDDAAASNQYFGTGPSLDPYINWSTLTVNVPELDITTPTDVDFFSFHVPGGTTGTMTVQLQGRGRSLLAPALTVYDVYGQQIGHVAGGGPWGSTVSLTFTGVTPYQTYYVRAAAADPASPFSVGKYSLMISHGNGPMPALSVPNTQTPNGSPLRSSNSQAQGSDHGHDHDGCCSFGGGVTDGVSEAKTPSPVKDIDANLVAILNGAAEPTRSSPISEDEADPVSLPRHEDFLPPVSDMPGLVRAAVLPPETEVSVAALDACFADDLGLALEEVLV
jgi:hypothetical protein